MGLKISELVPKTDISWGQLENKTIAIDASQMIYQFLSSIRQRDGTPLMDSKGNTTSHLVGIFSRVSNLINKKISLCFVFDGKPPTLKIQEQELRAHRKRVAEEKMVEAAEAEDIDAVFKYAKQTARLTDEMVKESKALLSCLGVPVLQAPSEAEAQAAYLCKKNDAWAVGSSDYDCLLFESPRLIQNLTLSTQRKTSSGIIYIAPMIIELKKVLSELKLSQEQLLCLAILVGTDYNTGGVKGFGPKKALKLVKELKTPARIFKQADPDFDWKIIFETFKKIPVEKKYSLKWSAPDEKKIRSLLIDKHEFSEARVNSTLNKLNESSEKHKQKGLFSWVK